MTDTTMTATTYMPHNREFERREAKTLVDLILDRGLTISVYDGGDWPLKRSTSSAEVLDAMGSTDSDTLRLRDTNGDVVANFVLVYGNSPGDLICDHSANDLAEGIWSAWSAVHPID
jgi:hypothetical protein